jgi:hypothetical protein
LHVVVQRDLETNPIPGLDGHVTRPTRLGTRMLDDDCRLYSAL